MYSYDGFKNRLAEKGLNKSDLTSLLGISSRTLAKTGKGEKLSKGTLQKIAEYLDCAPEQLFRCVSDNRILQILRDEKEAKISGGLYHELHHQCR